MSETRFLLTSQQTKRIKASVIVSGESVFLQVVEAAQARLVGNRTIHFPFHFSLVNYIFFLKELNGVLVQLI